MESWRKLGKAGKSWGKLTKANEGRTVQAFVDRCAFRSLARSGFEGTWGLLGALGGLLGALGGAFNALGFSWAGSWVLLGRFWSLLNVLGRSLVDFGSIWGRILLDS